MDKKFFQLFGFVGVIWSFVHGDVKATDEIALCTECGNRSTTGTLLLKTVEGKIYEIEEMRPWPMQCIKIDELKGSTISAKISKINGSEIECSNPIVWEELNKDSVPQHRDTYTVTFTACGNWQSYDNKKPKLTWKIRKNKKTN